MDRDRRRGVVHALAASSIGTLIVGVFAHFLTRRIYTLHRVLAQVRAGARAERAPPLGRDEVGLLAEGLNAMLDSLQERDEAVRSAGLYSRRLLEAALDPLFVIRRDGMIGDVNSATERVLGLSRHRLIGSAFAGYFTDPEAARRGYEQAYAEEQVRDYPLTLRDGQGRLVPVNFHASVYSDVSGRVAGLFAAARDMSEHQRLLAQARSDAQAKAQLLREVNHRVTNNLASMLGLISHEREHLGEAERAAVVPVLERLTQRLRGLMFVHRMLSDAQWAPVPIDQLARGVIGAAIAVAPVPPLLTVGPTVEKISPRQASALAMVFSELATNTIKHACAVAKPEVRCEIETLSPETVRIVYADNGPGFSSAVLELDHANIGLRLVRMLVEQSLRGRLRLGNDGGARVEMTLRLEDRSRT
jgi:PAS domain S-box-containing protein